MKRTTTVLAAIAVLLLGTGPDRSAALPAPAKPSTAPSPAKSGVVRTYYIAADEVNWDYTPQGRKSPAFLGELRRTRQARVPARVYHKAMYREYSDTTFQKLKPRPQQ